MRMRSQVVSFLVFAVSVIAACSSGSTSTTPTILTVVAFKGGGTELANMPDLNAAFQKAHPDITLQYKYVSPDYDTYVNSRLAAGTAPDVLMADKIKMGQWVKQGYLADLSDQPWVPRMYPSLKPFNSVNGKTYQLNSENIAIGFYSNLDLLKQNGIDGTPKTWPELISDLQTLQAKKAGGFLFANKGGWTGAQVALALAANLVKPDWATKYDAGQSSFDPDWAPVVDRIKALFASGTVDPKAMLGVDPWSDGLAQFEAGKWAFYVQGAWEMSDIIKKASFNFAFSTFPGGEAGTSPKTFTFVGTGWAVNAHAKNPSAAKAYVNFMSQPANELSYITAEAAFSTLKDVDSPPIAQAQPALASYKAGDTSPSLGEILNFSDVEGQLEKGIQLIFVNPGVSTGSVLQTLNQQIPRTP